MSSPPPKRTTNTNPLHCLRAFSGFKWLHALLQTNKQTNKKSHWRSAGTVWVHCPPSIPPIPHQALSKHHSVHGNLLDARLILSVYLCCLWMGLSVCRFILFLCCGLSSTSLTRAAGEALCASLPRQGTRESSARLGNTRVGIAGLVVLGWVAVVSAVRVLLLLLPFVISVSGPGVLEGTGR